MFSWFTRRRRAKLRATPFPPAWLAILQRHFPLYQRLPAGDRSELHGHIQVFLQEKRFEGCGGLEITDEIRVTIAAQACLLLLHRNPSYFPALRSILVYPAAYRAPSTRLGENGLISEEIQQRLGESWSTGSVILAWSAVESGAENPADGRNVVFHEFAHQLDQEDGAGDGAPLLGVELELTQQRSKYLSWARVMRTEFDQLRFHQEHGRRTLLDGYGATNPAEFFAVATECFFERGSALQQAHPDLYDELKEYYRQDPAQWQAPHR